MLYIQWGLLFIFFKYGQCFVNLAKLRNKNTCCQQFTRVLRPEIKTKKYVSNIEIVILPFIELFLPYKIIKSLLKTLVDFKYFKFWVSIFILAQLSVFSNSCNVYIRDDHLSNANQSGVSTHWFISPLHTLLPRTLHLTCES